MCSIQRSLDSQVSRTDDQVRAMRISFAVWRINGVLLIDMTSVQLNQQVNSREVISVAKYF